MTGKDVFCHLCACQRSVKYVWLKLHPLWGVFIQDGSLGGIVPACESGKGKIHCMTKENCRKSCEPLILSLRALKISALCLSSSLCPILMTFQDVFFFFCRRGCWECGHIVVSQIIKPDLSSYFRRIILPLPRLFLPSLLGHCCHWMYCCFMQREFNFSVCSEKLP